MSRPISRLAMSIWGICSGSESIKVRGVDGKES